MSLTYRILTFLLLGIVVVASSPILLIGAGQPAAGLRTQLFWAALGTSSLSLLILCGTALRAHARNRRALSAVEQVLRDGIDERLFGLHTSPERRGSRSVTAGPSSWSDALRLLSERLEENRRAVLGVLDGLSTSVALLDGEGRVLVCNKAFCRTFELVREELAGRPVLAVLPVAIQEQWAPKMLKAAHWIGDDVMQVEDRTSGRRWRMTLRRVGSAEGARSRLALLVEPAVTATEAVGEPGRPRELSETILENIRDAVLLVNSDGTLLDINRAAIEMFGYTRQHAKGLHLRRLLAVDPACAPEHMLDACLLSEDWKMHGRSMDVKMRRQDGSVFPAEVKLSNGQHGRRRVFIASVRDATAEERAKLLAKDRLHVVEMISRNQALSDVLEALTRMIEHQLPAVHCVVMLRNDGRLAPAAAASLPPDLLRGLQNLPIEASRLSCAAAASEARIVVVGDIARTGMSEPFRQAAQDHGIQASWSAPIFSSEGSVVGTVAVYQRERREPSADEVGLLEMASRLASVCIEQRELNQKLAFRAQHDSLTGVLNRTCFEERLKLAIAAARRARRPLGVLSVDLDRFKKVNDTLGHAAGDALLLEVAGRMQGCLRETDALARWGGDEFAVGILDPDGRADVETVARKVTESLQPAFHVDGKELSISATIGLSMYPDDGLDLETLMCRADGEMYKAKRDGGSTLGNYTPVTTRIPSVPVRFRTGLRGALERGEFALHFQPQFQLRTGQLVGVEALLRWNHPQLGLVPPSDFIPAAEESGLIVPIGAWVLREACRHVRALPQNRKERQRVAVNVSGLHFTRPDFLEHVRLAVQESGIPAGMLELELPENLLIENAEDWAGRMARLRDLGVRITVEGFGADYSSLSRVPRLPVDSLKIDRCFVEDLAVSPEGPALVRSIAALAGSLNLETTAPCVETQEQLQILESSGCACVQGYLFGVPLTGDELHQQAATLSLRGTAGTARTSPPRLQPVRRTGAGLTAVA